jgi:hypothetical protein
VCNARTGRLIAASARPALGDLQRTAAGPQATPLATRTRDDGHHRLARTVRGMSDAAPCACIRNADGLITSCAEAG